MLGDGDEGLSYYAVAVARRNNPSVNFNTLKDKVACFPGQFINLFVISVHFCGEHDAQYSVRLQYYGEEHSEIVAKIKLKRIENSFRSCRQLPVTVNKYLFLVVFHLRKGGYVFISVC